MKEMRGVFRKKKMSSIFNMFHLRDLTMSLRKKKCRNVTATQFRNKNTA